MNKLLIFLLMFVQVLSKKMVLDYGSLLKIDEAQLLHNTLITFEKNYKVEIIFITLPNEEKYNCEQSVVEEAENNSSSVIYIFRSPSSYKIYFHNFDNIDILQEKMNHIMQFNNDNYYEEFMNIVTFYEKEKIFKYKKAENIIEVIKKEKIKIGFLIVLIMLFIYYLHQYNKKKLNKLGMD